MDRPYVGKIKNNSNTKPLNHLYKYKEFYLVLFALVLKFALLPLAQTVDCDAVSRIFYSIRWHDAPFLIGDSVWAPLHFYLNGLGLFIYNNPIITPSIINIIISSLTIFPLYYLTKREFNENGAFVSSLFFFVSPILFRNSFMALSCTPFYFFFLLSLNYISKYFKEKSFKLIVIAGVFMTLASGFRFESWLLTFLFAALIAISKNYKMAFVFLTVSLVFPIYWLIQNKITAGNALYSFNWVQITPPKTELFDWETWLRKLWHFPLSYLISVGPIVVIILANTFYKIFNNNIEYTKLKKYRYYTIPFLLTFIIIIASSINGTVLLQHRFTGILVVLSLPFVSVFYRDNTKKKILITTLSILLTVGLSFIYNTNGVKPIPRLKDKNAAEVSSIISKNITPTDYLILDFWSWENTYFLALNAGVKPNQIILPNGNDSEIITSEIFLAVLNSNTHGFMVIKKQSKLFNLCKFTGNTIAINAIKKQYNFKTFYENEKVMLIEFS